MEVDQTACGDHSAVYTNIKLLYYTLEAKITLQINYTPVEI